ncbi:MAG TPA: response regulator transcription factor, partial [Marmoricola sp.]|nr:response regulator transcription factor [Marmoricola sp.]
MTVSVMVVDDHPVVRSGLAALLSAQTELQVLAEAPTGEDALELMGSTQPQVVLTDLRMGPGMDGVALTAALRELADPPAVIILTTYDHDHDIVRAI